MNATTAPLPPDVLARLRRALRAGVERAASLTALAPETLRLAALGAPVSASTARLLDLALPAVPPPTFRAMPVACGVVTLQSPAPRVCAACDEAAPDHTVTCLRATRPDRLFDPLDIVGAALDAERIRRTPRDTV